MDAFIRQSAIKLIHSEHIDRLLFRITQLRDVCKGIEHDLRYSISILLEMELRKALMTDPSDWVNQYVTDAELTKVIGDLSKAGIPRVQEFMVRTVTSKLEKAKKFLLHE